MELRKNSLRSFTFIWVTLPERPRLFWPNIGTPWHGNLPTYLWPFVAILISMQGTLRTIYCLYVFSRYHKASQTNSHALSEMAKIINLESNEDLETSSATEPMLISGKRQSCLLICIFPKCIWNMRHYSLSNKKARIMRLFQSCSYCVQYYNLLCVSNFSLIPYFEMFCLMNLEARWYHL